jgi:hypothetical protein
MGIRFTTPVRQASSVGHRRAAYLAGFRSEHSDLTLALRRLRTRKPDFSPAQLERIVASGVAEMDALAAQSTAQFERLSQARLHAYRAHRAFQDEHGLSAPAKTPDTLSTLLVLMICGLAEAAFTAVLMITGGNITMLEGIGYGATVAAVNLALGTLAGFLPLRYAGFKLHAPNPQARDVAIRTVSWGSFAFALFVLTVLHFAAARVRVTGSATSIFDFSSVSFGATFADYYALGVMAIGAVGAVLAVYKGFNGFSDPVPGYTDSRREAGERIEAVGKEAGNGALDTLAFIFAQSCEETQILLSEADDSIRSYADNHDALARRVADHNGLIETACDDLKLAAQDEAARQSFIAGHAQTPEPLRLEELKALTLPDLPDDPAGVATPAIPQADAFTRLQSAHDGAAAIIRSAFNAFLTDLTRFDFHPAVGPEGPKEIPNADHALPNTQSLPKKRANGHAPPLHAGK